MIDPMTSLAFSVYSSKGVYALLLGSGVSRASGIPTGWDIVQDLIRRLALGEGKDCGENPASWYESAYGKEPDYSELLEMIARTSAERGNLLRSYFEPTEQEREDRKKLPTTAHKAIARLVAGGYIRVIVTTNFDRLMEQALEAEGVVPNVISSADAVQGAAPLVHSLCTLVKVHGDYLDTRLKNTQQELAEYEGPMNRLLDQIFDEYGLIVCGWSADWDTALRAAIDRCPNRRYTTFWSAFGEVKGSATGLCQRRQAVVVSGRNADSFFNEVSEKVTSLAEISGLHPATTPVAVATVKRYLAEERYRIRLEGLIHEEVGAALSAVSRYPGRLYKARYDQETTDFLSASHEQFDRLLRLLIAGSYWGKGSTGSLWYRAVERVAQDAGSDANGPVKSDVAIYPAILLFYGCGIASLLGRRHSTLVKLLSLGRFSNNDRQWPLLAHVLKLENYCKFDMVARQQIMPHRLRHDLSVSPYVAHVLREPIDAVLHCKEEYEHEFARFEYIAALVFADWSWLQDSTKITWTKDWVPSGLYVLNTAAIRDTREEIKRLGDRWPLLKAGLFGGSVARVQSAVTIVDSHIETVRRGLGCFF